jgi:hypothetical protein
VATLDKLKDFQLRMGRFDKFAMISLSLDNNDMAPKGLIEEHGLTWPQARVGWKSPTASDYGVLGAPTYFVIGPDGKVLYDGDGDIRPVLEKALGTKLEDAEPSDLPARS